MHYQFKKYISLFFLSLFLFPLVEKEFHAIEHAYDVHCNATDKHFHELEHTCSICDYTITDSFSTPKNDIQFVISINHFEFVWDEVNIYSPSAFSDTPLRAPPVA